MTIRIDGANTAANPGITGTDTDTGLQFGTDEVNIVTGGNTRATVNSSGHLIVGGTTAGNAGTRTVSIGNPGVTTGGLQLWATTTGASYVQFGDGTGSASDHYRGLIGYEHNNDRMIFYTAGSKRLSILSGGGITFNNDTAAANALDDYEEGTWVPTIDIGASTTGITYSDQSGIYTKIGDVVTVGCYVRLSSKGTATGQVRIDGLPFAANIPVSANNAGLFINEGNNASWPQTTSYGLAWSDGYVYLRYNGTTSWVAIDNNNLTNTSQFYWSSTFKVS